MHNILPSRHTPTRQPPVMPQNHIASKHTHHFILITSYITIAINLICVNIQSVDVKLLHVSYIIYALHFSIGFHLKGSVPDIKFTWTVRSAQNPWVSDHRAALLEHSGVMLTQSHLSALISPLSSRARVETCTPSESHHCFSSLQAAAGETWLFSPLTLVVTPSWISYELIKRKRQTCIDLCFPIDTIISVHCA